MYRSTLQSYNLSIEVLEKKNTPPVHKEFSNSRDVNDDVSHLQRIQVEADVSGNTYEFAVNATTVTDSPEAAAHMTLR
ncbi:hypothetical protein BTUL_0069g00510 [Botrytis tulipae]|uniref:Uncharacterized protein n=1 Tax=Botrytis tulipae TaxID=87230 RepID=A0A4Z1EM61_9HELO|nr:hypothetical protein BTUL_0069g00510 [Botrytis tulipae]